MSSMPIRSFWHSPRSMNRLSGLLIGLSVMALAGLVGHWMVNRPVFVVKRVIVDSRKGELRHVSAPQVHAAIAETLNGTVLSADLQSVHRSLQSIPWVRSASVRRIWPNRLLVQIEEQQAVATWAGGRLVNHVGEAFQGLAADHEESCQLIPLSGPDGSQRLVLERARQLANWLAPLNRPLRSLRLTEQYAWTAELMGGLTLELGRDTLATPIEERVRMFVKTQPWLTREINSSGGQASITRADLRYATGYAFQTSSTPASHAAAPTQPQAEPQPQSSQALPLCIGVHA